MANYPFDQHFHKTVDELPEWDDAWWRLVQYPIESNDPLIEALEVAGYSFDFVSKAISELLVLPIETLFELALNEEGEEPALLVLQKSRSREVYEHAAKYCASSLPNEREAGVLVMMRGPGTEFRDNAADIVKQLASRETDDSVMCALAYALCHLDVTDRAEFLRRAANSPSAETRFAAAYSLGPLSDDGLIETKIALSKDDDAEVRSWATFSLHLSLEENQRARQDIRNAFFERLNDPDEEVRIEAFTGLARCGDERVLDTLIAQLKEDSVLFAAIKAATELGHSSLYPHLMALKERWSGSEPEILDEAIQSCTPTELQ